MADIIRIRAKNGNGITWQFVDEAMVGYQIQLDQAPTFKIEEGDIWQAEVVNTSVINKKKIATMRLIARVQVLQPWEKLTSLNGHWIDPLDLQTILIWLNCGTDVLLIGHKGTGKTSLGYKIAEILGWQDPCKVDVYTMKRTTDLFGTEAAHEGSTRFMRSSFLDYIERAIIADKAGMDTQFLVILDEINRVHAKANESLHGLFDDTRQVTINTTEGYKIVKLPPNIHVIGTMNIGAEYQGVYELDDALKDRFAPIKIKAMPTDVEVEILVQETGILSKQALSIVQVAEALRRSAAAGDIHFCPSYRGCRNVARLVKHSMPLKQAVIQGFLGWYSGEFELNESGEIKNPNSEMAKAFSALRMKGVAKEMVTDLVGKFAV